MKQTRLLTLTKSCSAFLCSIFLLLGCGGNSKPLPETFAVKGTIRDKSNSPVQEGMLSFQSPDNAEHSAQAEIQPDGRFQLFTIVEGQRIDGALPGDYRAIFFPRMSESQSELPVELGQTFSVKAGENVFEIKLEK